jgi:Ca-activated chloride channel family protein
MDAYFARVSHAALIDVAVDWGTLDVSEVYPQRVPDLFVGRPLILTGRFTSAAPTVVRIAGRAAGEPLAVEVPIVPDALDAQHAGLPAVWARHKLADLAYRHAVQPNADWPATIKTVALEFGLMSDYTAFVAVDGTEVTAGDSGVTVPVPVPVPDGVRYETTVQE